MKREAKELNNLIEQVSQKVVDKVVNEKYLVSRMAVIVNEFDPNTNSASIIIPTDLSNHTDYKYPNRTGMSSLRSTVWENGQIKTYGDKVYLVYQANNISQGWLESNKSLDIIKEASKDYLTKADAAETYVKKSGDTMTGSLFLKASGWNARVSAIDTVHNGEVDLAFGVNHADHGVYSTGYSTDGSSWTSNGKWLIYRGTGGIGVAGNALVIYNNNNAKFSGQINADGAIRSESYGSFGGNAYVDGGSIYVGTSTLSSGAANVVCRSIAGDIYFRCGTTATDYKDIWVKNNAGSYKNILRVDQNNNVLIPTDITVKTNITASTNVNASLANNNVSSTTYPTTMNIVDNANRIIARTESVVNPNGNIGMYMYVRNYNTSGAQVAQKGLRFHMNKSGALSWSVSDPANFVAAIKSSIVDAIYPVGSIYISTNSTSPATLFGGTWEAFGQGRVLVGVGTGNDGTNSQTFNNLSTGGEYKHKLTVNELAKHGHQLKYWVQKNPTGGQDALLVYGMNTGTPTVAAAFQNQTGNDEAHNNVQPYIGVYMWRRTA